MEGLGDFHLRLSEATNCIFYHIVSHSTRDLIPPIAVSKAIIMKMDTLPHSIMFYIKYPLSNSYNATLSILPELVGESEYKSIFNQRQSNYFK